MKVKRPQNIRWCHPQRGFKTAHRVQTGDNFVKLAAQYGFEDPWDIIQFNYGTKDPEEVNWYLRELVGCTRSNDGINYSFDSSDKFGIVYIPPKGWKAGKPYETTHGYDIFKYDGGLAGYLFEEAPFVSGNSVSTIFNHKIFIVGDDSLRVAAEYNYGNIIFVRAPKDPGHKGIANNVIFIKELIHLAYGIHGMNMPYSLRTEAVAVIGTLAISDMLKSYSKLPPQQIFSTREAQKKILSEAASVLAAYKKDRGATKIDAMANLIAREHMMISRLSGHWPKAKAA